MKYSALALVVLYGIVLGAHPPVSLADYLWQVIVGFCIGLAHSTLWDADHRRKP